jgi:energy-coupling factor transport system ATP-binding protein
MSDTLLPLEIKSLTFRYRRRTEPAIRDISFAVRAGEVLLIAGASGSGKTTLIRSINGLIPHTYGGEGSGEVLLFGQPVSQMSMAQISQRVGTVLQDPERQIVGSYVLNEVAFGLENLGLPRGEIIQRVDETLQYLGILHLRERETFSLSGGEKQKLALAGVLAMRPRLLLLDEPLANLDPASAREALQLFRDLTQDGIAVVIVEHRVEDVLAIEPETVLYLDGGRVQYYGDRGGLGQTVDYHRIKLPAPQVLERARADPPPLFSPALKPGSDETLVSFKGVSFRYNSDSPDVLNGISFDVRKGDVIAILGHNGAGKTTLVKHLVGLLQPSAGTVRIGNVLTRGVDVADLAAQVGYVFQNPDDQLFKPTVWAEVTFGPRNLGWSAEQADASAMRALEMVGLQEAQKKHPYDLSPGQRKRVAMAAVLAMQTPVLVLDEPTTGQDEAGIEQVGRIVEQLKHQGRTVITISHDIDFCAEHFERVVVMSQGRISADGAARAVLSQWDVLSEAAIYPPQMIRLAAALGLDERPLSISELVEGIGARRQGRSPG